MGRSSRAKFRKYFLCIYLFLFLPLLFKLLDPGGEVGGYIYEEDEEDKEEKEEDTALDGELEAVVCGEEEEEGDTESRGLLIRRPQNCMVSTAQQE